MAEHGSSCKVDVASKREEEAHEKEDGGEEGREGCKKLQGKASSALHGASNQVGNTTQRGISEGCSHGGRRALPTQLAEDRAEGALGRRHHHHHGTAVDRRGGPEADQQEGKHLFLWDGGEAADAHCHETCDQGGERPAKHSG